MAAPAALGMSASQVNLGTSASSLALFAAVNNQQDGEKDVFAQRDLETLKTLAHKKSRKVLRSLSFPAIPLGSEGGTRRKAAAAAPASAVQVKTQKVLSPIQYALGDGVEAEAARAWVSENRSPFAVDTVHQVIDSGSSLEWIDNGGLTASLNSVKEMQSAMRAQTPPGGDSRAEEFLLHRYRSDMDFGVSTPSHEQVRADDVLGQAVRSVRAHRRRVAAHRWPSLAQFEEYYHPPDDLLPDPPAPKDTGNKPLPEARKTISRMEESSVQSGSLSKLHLSVHHMKEKEQAKNADRHGAGKPAGIFEANRVYRYACEQLGIEPPFRLPIMGEHIEITDNSLEGTRQCYALAEAVRACMPKRLLLIGSPMTDMGASRIVEAAIVAGRLQHLCITGTPLSFRTSTALHACLRMRAASTLTELTLQSCGLGGDLDVEPDELPGLAATAYNKSKSSLPAGILSPPDADADKDSPEFSAFRPLQRSVSEPEEDHEDFDRERSGCSTIESSSAASDRLTDPIPVLLPLIIHLARPGCALRRLDLSSSALSAAAGRAIGWALGNSALEALALVKCGLKDESVIAIANGLAQNRWLQELKLRGNKLSRDAGPTSELFHVVGHHSSLAHLDFAENHISRDSIAEFCAMLRWSCSLVAVHILGLGIGGIDAVKVARACRAWIAEQTPEQEIEAEAFGLSSGSREEAEIDTFGEDEEEVILCRALHVEPLSHWQMAAPVQVRKAKVEIAATAKETDIRAPTSWMPSACWVCERCSTVEFKWVVPDRGEGDESGGSGTRLFLRPSFATWGRVELQRERSAGARRVTFSSRLLVPPGSHCYLFEAVAGRKNKKLHWARDQPVLSLADAKLTEKQQKEFYDICQQYTYQGKLNQLSHVDELAFQIPEHMDGEAEPEPVVDPWAEDPVREQRLRSCFDVDLPLLHLDEICHEEEEEEVKETIWELYGRFYDTFSIFAGRSYFPLIRQVDVYGFFEEARLLDRGPLERAESLRRGSERAESRSLAGSQPISPPSAGKGLDSKGGEQTPPQEQTTDEAGGDDAVVLTQKPLAHPLTTQDVQQMIVQTITRRKSELGRYETSLVKRRMVVVQRHLEGAPITRPQFLEVLLRAAVALRGREPSTSLALRRFCDKILTGRIMQPPLSPFPRGLASQAGEVRDTLLARRKSLRQAHERFGSSETSFQRMAQLLKLCDRAFTAKHVASIYALARRPQADFKKLLESSAGLSYDEFSEAVSRLAMVWQKSRGRGASPGTIRDWPSQPQYGCPVRAQVVASRLGAFLERLADRMRPSIVANPSIL